MISGSRVRGGADKAHHARCELTYITPYPSDPFEVGILNIGFLVSGSESRVLKAFSSRNSALSAFSCVRLRVCSKRILIDNLLLTTYWSESI